MKILIVLNYYWPYTSGLTEAARCIAEELAVDNEVTVLTSKHLPNLTNEEYLNGVRVIRTDILFRFNKGYISPSFISTFNKLKKDKDIINLHLPMAEAGILSFFSENKNLIITYQCDVYLPKGIMNKMITKFMDITSNISFRRAYKVIISSEDYANSSRVLPECEEKWIEIPPTSPMYKKLIEKNKQKIKPNKNIRIGFCGRIVEEKGIDVLLRAAPIIKSHIPNVEFVIAGDYKSVAGGSVYEILKETIGWDGSYVSFLGKLTDDEMLRFYSSLDILALPSINSLEAFGMVQVEAMLSGVPVVTSNLPGVRSIVQKSQMGVIVAPGDVDDLVKGIKEIILKKEKYIKEKETINKFFGTKASVSKYLDLFQSIIIN
ncbi:glycosyltransferase family 4 protein [Fodinisporobacter ferrooxydans]|uniref:Glycosyltransferase family 4 protein n=1 Tax=Fodinisporobacter ferrooxydans TaxID=2901836 RepID=A0ABY4CQJ1_9BACL|nr:glycosyltransferase family 4 protein [Alicyclobacillaceae bacterium MYW30-H2]